MARMMTFPVPGVKGQCRRARCCLGWVLVLCAALLAPQSRTALAQGTAFSQGGAFAQDAPMHSTTIVAQGQSKVDVVPDYAEFWFHKGVIAADKGASALQEATATALEFATKLRKELETRKVAAPDIVVYGPTIPEASLPHVRISVRVRFATTRFSDPENGPKLFAGLCDTMREVAKALGLLDGMVFGTDGKPALEGPLFRVEDPGATERAAISSAVENAYPHAEAVAQTMRAQITAVDSVRIDQAIWGDHPELNAPASDYRRITCMVKVTVSYAFAPTQP